MTALLLYTSNQPKDGFGENLIVPAGMKAAFGLFVRHPDFVSCRTVGSQVDNTEIRLIDPQGAIVAGGDDITGTGEFFTGEKSTVNNGSSAMWRLEVGSRDGLGLEAHQVQRAVRQRQRQQPSAADRLPAGRFLKRNASSA